MAKLQQVNQIARDFAEIADFVIIYMGEAHPTDGFFLQTNDYNIRKHRSLEERMSAAEVLSDTNPACPIWVDGLDDEACRLYGASPERLYIILDDVIVYAGQWALSFAYRPDEVREWLQRFK
jgi:hypothetical protein